MHGDFYFTLYLHIGWCLVNQVTSKKVGWVPEGFLKKPEEDLSDYLDDTVTDEEEQDSEIQSDSADMGEAETNSMLYHAIAEYSTDDLSQIAFPEGAQILVIDQDEDGEPLQYACNLRLAE